MNHIDELATYLHRNREREIIDKSNDKSETIVCDGFKMVFEKNNKL